MSLIYFVNTSLDLKNLGGVKNQARCVRFGRLPRIRSICAEITARIKFEIDTRIKDKKLDRYL